jgi:hypothetical protein
MDLVPIPQRYTIEIKIIPNLYRVQSAIDLG